MQAMAHTKNVIASDTNNIRVADMYAMKTLLAILELILIGIGGMALSLIRLIHYIS
jgi:hypothetical protein